MTRRPYSSSRDRIAWARTVNDLAVYLGCHAALPVRDVRPGQPGPDLDAPAHGLVSGPRVGTLDPTGSGNLPDHAPEGAARLADQGHRSNPSGV